MKYFIPDSPYSPKLRGERKRTMFSARTVPAPKSTDISALIERAKKRSERMAPAWREEERLECSELLSS